MSKHKLCLVTGAGGFIGNNLVELLISKGYSVRATDLDPRRLSYPARLGAQIMAADLLDPAAVKSLVQDVDLVFHLAAIFDLSAPYQVQHRVNVEAVESLYSALLDSDVECVVHWSTVGVYGKPMYTPMDEEHPKHPRNPYELTKWQGEQLAWKFHEQNGLPILVLRPALVYGPRNRYGLALLIGAAAGFKHSPRKLLRGRGITMADGPLGHFVHVADVVNAAEFLAGLRSAIGQAYNICDDSPIRLGKLLNLINRKFGLELSVALPYSPRITPKIFNFTYKFLLKDPALSLVNKGIDLDWRTILAQHGIPYRFKLRIDRDWLMYLLEDTWYDNSKLKSTGYKLLYPDVLRGFSQTIDWYIQQRWVPG